MPTRRQMACDEELLLYNGKENSAGRNSLRTSEILCPESTSTAVALEEQPELRAYKLGKQKCSYNQVELVINDVSGGKMSELRVSEAIETIVGTEVEEQLRESCLKFHVRFINNARIQLYIYVVYSSPYGTTRPDKHTALYQWMPVTRSKCRKGCTGPVIRGLQRFGRMPRRGAAAVYGEDTWKEPRHLYIAIDEATTHVCARHETSKFRLLVAAYDDKHQLLGTTVSSSIRVLANNDAPLGAASFKLHCHLKGVPNGSSPIRSSRHQLGDHPLSVQCRLPLQALPPNTSPSRSKTTATEENCKSESIPSAETAFSMLSTRSKSSNKQLVAVRGADQSRNPDFEDLHSDMSDHVVVHVTEKVLEACSMKPVESIISLRTLARIVGSKRGVVADIFSVLQSVGVVEQHEKEKFRWLGSSSIVSALAKVSKEVNPNARRKLLATSTGSRFGPNTCLTQQRAFRYDEKMDNSMCGLGERLIRLFLNNATTPVSWDQALAIFLDNHHEKNSEDIRLKERRLLEMLGIFETMRMVKKCICRRYSASTTYEWVGADPAIIYLNRLSAGSTKQSNTNGSGPRYLRSSKHPPARRRRDVIGESAIGIHHCDDECASNSIQLSNQRSEVPANCQLKKLENDSEISRRSTKRKFSGTNKGETQPFFASRLANCQKLPGHKYFSTRTGIPKRPRLVVSSSLVTGLSSTVQNDGNCSGRKTVHRTYQPSFPQRTASQMQTSCRVLDPIIQPALQDDCAHAGRDCSTKQHVRGDACDNRKYPSESRSSSSVCIFSTGTEAGAKRSVNLKTSARFTGVISPPFGFSLKSSVDPEVLLKTGAATFEGSSASDLELVEAPNSQLRDDNVFPTENGSGPSVFQFPYKKRPHNWSSFLSAAAPRCFDQMFSIEYSHPRNFMELTNWNDLPCFKPLYYLQHLLTPQQVEHFTAQNPAFLFHYVHYFRVFYHKLSAQATGKGGTVDQAVVRPVAEHGAVEMLSHLMARKGEDTSFTSPLPSTLHQLLIPFSQGGLWLGKDSKDYTRFAQATCLRPNSTHHVDSATTEGHRNLER